MESRKSVTTASNEPEASNDPENEDDRGQERHSHERRPTDLLSEVVLAVTVRLGVP